MATPGGRPAAAVVALVRDVSPRLADCVLTHLDRVTVDVDRARAQHEVYCRELAALGARIEPLPPLPEAPDGVFVEDTAVVVDELAVLCRPGVASREQETATMAAALTAYRAVHTLPPDARLEGGDVMRVGRTLYVGRSGRTNAAGIEALRTHVAPAGYQVEGVDLDGCLHLKTACTFVPPAMILANTSWVDPRAFRGLTVIAVPRDELFGANTLTLGGVTLVGAAFPATARRLRAHGVVTRAVDVSELAKAEGALTCSSVILQA
jgi:dimethylargininase